MRTLSLTLAFSLLVLIAVAALAREVLTDARPDFAASAPPPTTVTTSALRADTLFLFAASGPGAWGMPGTNERGYTFDDGNGGSAPAGWTPYDGTADNAAYWHLQALTLSDGHPTDFSSAG